MTSEPGQQTIAIHILTNISRSSDNYTVKTGQLLEFNLINNFLEKSYTKCAEKLFPDPFLKISKKHISGSIFQSLIYFVFYCLPR